MISDQIRRAEARIEEIKRELLSVGPMRPGSLTKQYNVCGNPSCHCKDEKDPQRHGPYYQLRYTVGGKGTTEFVKEGEAEELGRQLEEYKRFRELTREWVDLSVQIAKGLRKLARGQRR